MTITPEQLLLEEWKQNVALYIDQDKRGLERIKMFLTVHAGLLVLYGILWKAPLDGWSVITAWLLAVAGLFFTFITQRMSKRAHAYILLRKLQGMVIEKEMKGLMAADKPWRTSSKVMTTFTREHVLFRSEKDLKEDPEHLRNEWQSLIEEFQEMGEYASDPVTLKGRWKSSMGHLKWLTLIHGTLYIFWPLLGILTTVAYYWDC